MFPVYAHGFLNIGRELQQASTVLILYEDNELITGDARAEHKTELIRMLTKLSKSCEGLGLTVAKRGLDRAIARLPETGAELNAITAVVADELEDHLFFHVPKERAKFHRSSRADNSKVLSLPTATKELTHAGNCIAFAEYTASIFHSMRAVETAIDAVFQYLKIAPPPKQNRSWGLLCNALMGEIQARTKSSAQWPERTFFLQVHETLVAIKDVYRNDVMHGATVYEEHEAKRIIDRAQHLIEQIGSKMDEDGLEVPTNVSI